MRVMPVSLSGSTSGSVPQPLRVYEIGRKNYELFKAGDLHG